MNCFHSLYIVLSLVCECVKFDRHNICLLDQVFSAYSDKDVTGIIHIFPLP